MPDDIFSIINEHVSVPRETFERLRLYHDLLIKWQAKINLIGPDTVPEAWQRHFLDSLQLQKYMPSNYTGSVIDMGSGAGFPGMALAILGYKNIHLIESDLKKVTFLREVSRITQADVNIHAERIEKVLLDDVSVITSRACASLHSLLFFSSRFVSHETICLFHKGKNYSSDIEDTNMDWLFDTEVFPSVVDPEGVILKITNLRKRGV